MTAMEMRHIANMARNMEDGDKRRLTILYVDIAEIYIQRAARKGLHQTAIYLPRECREDGVQALARSGFTVDRIRNPENGCPHPTMLMVKWDEDWEE